VGLVYRGQVLEALERVGLEPGLVLVELRAGHPSAAAGLAHVAQGLGQLQNAQSVTGHLLWWVHAPSPLRPPQFPPAQPIPLSREKANGTPDGLGLVPYPPDRLGVAPRPPVDVGHESSVPEFAGWGFLSAVFGDFSTAAIGEFAAGVYRAPRAPFRLGPQSGCRR